MSIGNHKDYVVWQKAMDLVVKVYQLTEAFPQSELYGLSSQLRRASVSIPSNIAEGRRRGSEAEFRHFLRIAFGSAAEVETQLELARRLKFGKEESYLDSSRLLDEVMRMLNVLTADA